MTEREKMLAGEYYNSRDPELLERYYRSRAYMQAYNALPAADADGRARILAEWLAYKGEGVWIEAPFYCDYGDNISIGENTFVNLNCIFLDDNQISIGRNVLIGPNVQIYTALHPLSAADRIVTDQAGGQRYLTRALPVSIGDNAWIGGGAILLPGVRIGDNAVIGAGAVVTKDIPDHALALGNPCRVIQQ